jgi:hypothetical protein
MLNSTVSNIDAISTGDLLQDIKAAKKTLLETFQGENAQEKKPGI